MIKDKKKKESKVHIVFLIIAIVSFLAYLIVELLNFDNINSFLPQLLGITLVLIFLISMIVISIKAKKGNSAIIIGCLLIIVYSIINILLSTKLINFPKDEYVPNFYNKSIAEVEKWEKDNNIKVTINNEYSDTVQKDFVISQNVNAPTLTKDIKEIIVTVSLGVDSNKEIIVPSFIGLKYDEVLKYIEENHLSNVTIEYQNSEKEKDIVISQSKSGTMKRSDEIVITFSKTDEETGEIEIIDFTNKTELYAKSWLEKYGFKVEIKEDYSDDIPVGYVISQSNKDETKNPETDTITLVISKGKKIIAPDIVAMNVNEINNWATENNIRISYKEEYSDEIKLGDVITSSVNKDDLIDPDKKIEITISKGKLEMIKLTTINEFINWAETNKVDYDINYENNEKVKKDEIIKCSHNTGDPIKKNDTVIITVSRGNTITIPNFVGMNKSDISSKCKSINLSCNFKTGGYSESTKAGIAVSQSKKSGTKVSEGTSLTITLSAGIQEKVNVPNFVGKTKSEISKSCSSIGIKCNFKYASGFNSKAKDTALSQSTTGKVNKGSSITITLSNGPAKTYTIVIPADWLSWGNPSATKATLENRLKSKCPGVSFKFSYKKVNSGIGYLNPSSQVKVGSNTFTQGKSYNVIINSN